MKKKIWIPVCAALVALLVLTAVLLIGQNARKQETAQLAQVQQTHGTILAQYETLCANLEAACLTVKENGKTIGTYSLAELGAEEPTRRALDAQFSELDRMSAEAFAALTAEEQLTWAEQTHPEAVTAAVDCSAFDAQAVLTALNSLPRTQPENAKGIFENGVFSIRPAVSGNTLREQIVTEVLRAAASSLTISAGAPAQVSVELTEHDCYLRPEVTEENLEYDLPGSFNAALSEMSLSVAFWDEMQTLEGDVLSTLLSLGEDGMVSVDAAAVERLLEDWSAQYMRLNTEYIFDSFADGPMPIEFLQVDYYLDRETLRAELTAALERMQSGTIEAPFLCMRYGLPFAIENTYIEVDVTTQHMAYYRDGALVIDTDIVTGDPFVSATPRGLYYTFYKDEDLWLVGPTWNDFVDYWISVTQDSSIGIHDADWQEAFGGETYLEHGSHGCINTPKEAVKVIYENLQVENAVPILVFLHPGDEY